MTREDWPAVEAIYEQGIATRAATFETEPPEYDAFAACHHPEHQLVAVASRSSTVSGATPSCWNSGSS